MNFFFFFFFFFFWSFDLLLPLPHLFYPTLAMTSAPPAGRGCAPTRAGVVLEYYMQSKPSSKSLEPVCGTSHKVGQWHGKESKGIGVC